LEEPFPALGAMKRLTCQSPALKVEELGLTSKAFDDQIALLSYALNLSECRFKVLNGKVV
jgi:hypothetical protein